jgi:ribonuclease Z
VPPLPAKLLESAFLGDAPSKFDGKITVGSDGLIFSLPAGSDAIKTTRGY